MVGYGAGRKVAVIEAIRGLIEAGKETVKEVEGVEKTVTGEVGKVAGGAEGLLGSAAKGAEGMVHGVEHHGEQKP